jgi:hypothetical protein
VRLVSCLAVAVLCATFAAPARADKCLQGCSMLNAKKCKDKCAEQGKKKEVEGCTIACDMQVKLCPDMCAVKSKCGKDQQCMQREMKALGDRKIGKHGPK